MQPTRVLQQGECWDQAGAALAMARLKPHHYDVPSLASDYHLCDPVAVPILFVALLIVATIVAAVSF